MDGSIPLIPGNGQGRARQRPGAVDAPGPRWLCAALVASGLFTSVQAESLGQASVQATAQLEAPAYYDSNYLAPGLGACNVTAQALTGASNMAAACRSNPSDDRIGRIPGPLEAPEYTLRTEASATPATSASQLPALRVRAGIQRTPRLGEVSWAFSTVSAQARHRGFIAWDPAQSVDRIQFELAVTGHFAYSLPLESESVSALALDLSAQRGWLLGPDRFEASVLPPAADGYGTLEPYGTLRAGADWSVDGRGFYEHAADFRTNAGNTLVEVFVPSQPGCLPGAAGCTGDWQPWWQQGSGSLQTLPNQGELAVDLHLRVTLGCDIACYHLFGDDPPPGATDGSVKGVLVDFSSLASAELYQYAYTSHTDDVFAGHGFMDVDFGNTFQVSNLKLYDGEGDVTAQSRVVYAGSYEEAFNLAYLPAAVPEPGTWALWLAGLAGLGRVMRLRLAAQR